jgi:CHAT domain-containing protein
VVLFVVAGNGIRALEHRVPSGELVSRVRLARELTSAPGGRNAADPVLRSLHAILIQPLEDAGTLDGVSRLILVPHGPLAYLPFAALLDQRQAPLVSRYATLVLPSASTFAALRLRPDASGPRTGSVTLAPLPRDLPGSRVELDDVSRVLGGRVLLGDEATEVAFRSALASASVVHIATHGIMNAINPMFSRLELAPGHSGTPEDDGRLEIHEVLGLSIGAELVYLSGCETGKGPAWRTGFERGEDFVTLSQAFLYAGAHNVVATLWRVDDAGAAAFAREFYRAWRGGDPVEALATAQRAMLRQPAYRDPYYWAAYQVSGAGVAPAGVPGITASRTP